MSIGWMVSIVALWVVVLIETRLLLLLLCAPGELKQQSSISMANHMPFLGDGGLEIGEQDHLSS